MENAVRLGPTRRPLRRILAQLFNPCGIEFNKDYIEQGLKPVSKIPYIYPGKILYLPLCWARDLWPWPTVTNPVHACQTGPIGGMEKTEVLKQVVRNRFALKGKIQMSGLMIKLCMHV